MALPAWSKASRPAEQPESRHRPAVFLDRDGTLIEDIPYLSDPAKVQLLPQASAALRCLQTAGFACVVVTNQSGIGRGMLTVEVLEQIHQEMKRQLATEGAVLDAIYYCPVVPTREDRSTVEHFDRKPGPGMLFRASEALGLDLARSWMIGDKLSDLLAGIRAGCRGSILVRTGQGLNEEESRLELPYHVADDLLAAAQRIVEASVGDTDTSLTFSSVSKPMPDRP